MYEQLTDSGLFSRVKLLLYSEILLETAIYPSGTCSASSQVKQWLSLKVPSYITREVSLIYDKEGQPGVAKKRQGS